MSGRLEHMLEAQCSGKEGGRDTLPVVCLAFLIEGVAITQQVPPGAARAALAPQPRLCASAAHEGCMASPVA